LPLRYPGDPMRAAEQPARRWWNSLGRAIRSAGAYCRGRALRRMRSQPTRTTRLFGLSIQQSLACDHAPSRSSSSCADLAGFSSPRNGLPIGQPLSGAYAIRYAIARKVCRGDGTGSMPDASGTGDRVAKSPSNALTQGSQIGILRSGPAGRGACRFRGHFRKVLFPCFLRAGWLLLRRHCR
jgi:hypothetical protein